MESNLAEEESDSQTLRFSPDEEASLLKQSNTQKEQANTLFGSTQYAAAIEEYDKALASCPNYLDYEVAVLRSNIAACHLKLADWKSAVSAATYSVEALDRLEGIKPKKTKVKKDEEVEDTEEEATEEIVSPAAEKIATDTALIGGRSREDVRRIRAKALRRRAKARNELGGWSALQGAEEDYKALVTMPGLPAQEMRVVRRALVALPSRIDQAKQKEMGEMMGKLKELGNGILKPFGLSTDNFKMAKDESSGGYSMQFDQGGK